MSKIYMVGNTHFDPVWLWTWDEAMSSIRATFRSALDRMKEDENFIYSFSCPPVFEWIKNVDGEMFDEIKQRVKEGRWDICEGWWNQPDCYTACGESYVRQSLYGQYYLYENFGKFATSAFNVDSFGHSPMLPQILKKSGINNYCFVRPEKKHVSLKSPLFKWKSPDGSVVNTYRAEQGWEKDLKSIISERLDNKENSLLIYGVTDHGGAPTKEAIKTINENKETEFSSVDRFFAENSPKVTVSKELITNDYGVYANNPEIKQLNRMAEYALLNAEKVSAFAGKNSNELLKKLWQDALFNQFHDILGGACIKEAYFDAKNLYGRVISSANEILHYGIQSVTKNIKMLGKNPVDIWNLVVWNLNSEPFDGYIETEVQWAHEFEWYDKGLKLVDADGNEYPCQIIDAKAVIPKFRSRFVCKVNAPSFGYKVYKVVKTEEDEPIFDEDLINGYLEKYSSDMFRPVCLKDDGDTWCFNVKGYGKKTYPKLKERKVLENGKLRSVVKETYKFKDSLIYIKYVFYRNEEYFDCYYKVNWNEKYYALKFETSVKEYKHKAQVPYGSAMRGRAMRDVPVGEYLEIDGKTYLLDGIFAYNLNDKKLGFTVLRSPIYGDLRLDELDFAKEYDHISEGITEGKLRIQFNGKNKSDFLNKPKIVIESNHNGELPCEKSYCKVEEKNVTVSVIKFSESGGGYVLRIVETEGNKGFTEIDFMNKKIKVSLKPFEIKTLLIENETIKEVNLLEN